eukprot:scaffold5178_cov141-Skeletonema_menzelii.AAC.6
MKSDIENSPVTYARRYTDEANSNRANSRAKGVTFKMDDASAAKLYAHTMYGDDEVEMEAPSTPVHHNRSESTDSEVELTPNSEVSSSSSDAAGAYSKKAMIKMMKEQIDLVRTLTNAQIAQKKELEEVKAAKKKLEEERLSNDAKSFNNRSSSSRLNLPTRSTSDGKDSDNQSISTFSRYFRSPHKQREPRTTKYRHPDEAYYARDRAARARARTFSDEAGTVTNVDPSLASTIGMPSAIMIDAAAANTTGAFHNDTLYDHSLPHRFQSPTNDRIEITAIPERNVIPADELRNDGCLTKMWWFFSRLCTFFVPDILLCCIGRSVGSKVAKKEAKQAWREKVGIFVIMMLSSAAFIGDEIQARNRAEDWTVIFGIIFDMKDYMDVHPGGDQIQQVIGADASKYFPRRPVGRLPSVCTNSAIELSTTPECDEFDDLDKLVKSHCHTSSVGFSGINKSFGNFEKGTLAHRLTNLKNSVDTDWIMVYNRIYNVTRYIDGIKDEVTGEIDAKSENAYLSKDLTSLLINKRGQDATKVYEALFSNDIQLSCLDDLFYIGVLDEKDHVLCQALNIAMYSVMIVIAAVLGIQCLCSLIYLVRLKRTITRDDTRSKIIVMVPCYNEGDKELRKTIDSVMDTTYPDDNKVLLVVADGNITGKGEKMSTPDTLAKILGYKQSPTDRAYDCKSIGELTENRAKIYYGTYIECGRELKYIVIVKCGLHSEKGSPRAGNRGKRDSQLLFTGLLNRFHHGRNLNNLDIAIKYALDNLQLPLDEIRYLMAIDADTRIDRESLSHMTYSMNKNDRVLALCGETKVDNKAQSWVTMIQVFEYYTNHHMKKAFESVFGCVTCLPGCFTMYRLFSDDGRPLLSCDDVYQRYATNNVKTLHDKNLYHLGEDRMLTTLLLRFFPDMKLSFVPEATCYTIVPHTFSVLLSQRRRWINSTFHNMLELMRVDSLCGICCLSMKSVVVLDLVATLILPASLIYVGYIVFITFWMGEPLSMLMLVIWGIVIGVQVVVFLLRSRWDYWWWFFVFVLVGVPVFYFILPLYSFWHMDDFSWGTTRQVSGNKGNLTSVPTMDTDAESPRGFEVVGSKIINADDYESKAQRNGGVRQPKQHARSAPVRAYGAKSARPENGTLNLMPKLNATFTGPVDLDEVEIDDESRSRASTVIKFDRAKYKNADEARKSRRERRGEC